MDIPKKELEFIKQLREKARNDDAAFQYEVGCCYDFGYGIEKSYKEAVKWYTLAAEKGESRAQLNLGNAYYFGNGIEQDYKQAVEWYERSANQENPIALNNLACCYEQGKGVEQDFDKAVTLFKHSVDSNHWCTFRNLGAMYQDGKGVTQNLEKSKEYYEKALTVADERNDYWDWQVADETDKKSIQDQIDGIDAKLAKLAEKAAEARKAKRTEIFISYAHADMEETDYVKELKTHLKPLERTNKITTWSDENIKLGNKWDAEIKAAISRAKFAVLMVSADFFASDYIVDSELDPILKSVEETGATIFWVLVSTCNYEIFGIGDYQAIKKNIEKPLIRCEKDERNEIYVELVKRIKELSPKQQS